MSLDAAESQPKLSALTPARATQIMARRWMVVAGHPLAAQAAARILEGGGNAVDAGVAAGICLGVVHPDMVSVAGVAPLMVHLAGSGETHTVSGVGPWPRRASVEFFKRECEGRIPIGVLRTVVPAAPDAWCTALALWGTRTFSEVAAPALELAAGGFPLSAFSAMLIRSKEAAYRRWPTSAALYLPGGRPRAAGDLFVQSELAGTLESMMDTERRARGRGRAEAIRAARDAFYTGPIAEAICAFHRQEGGLLTPEDLSQFSVEVLPALATTFRDVEVRTCGFWCQGPALLQMLNLLEPYDLGALGHNSPRYLHLLAEAIKLAFADREAYYGDPNHVKVPGDGLLSKAYAERRRALIAEDQALAEAPPGDPLGLAAVKNGWTPPAALQSEGPGDMDTSYVAVVDSARNAFSATPSDPSVDSPVVPGLGCVVSPRGSQGWLDPAHPSAVAPGKRPRLTPAPAMAFKGGRVWMPFGTPGGDVQLQAMLQAFLNVACFGMAPQEAVEAPRVTSRSFPDSFWPHPTFPRLLHVEARISAEVAEALAALGHRVELWPEWEWRAGAVCAIVVGPDGTLMAGADPRRGAHAIGW